MIWLIGYKGMLGTELSLILEKEKIPFVGTDKEIDITKISDLDEFSKKQVNPIQWIINCAAYTAVDKAEDDKEICRLLNTDGAGNIACIAKKINANLIHISTDYVFNGQGNTPYTEEDITDPIGFYGLTKRDGEIAVLENNPNSFIIRTAWLYGKHGNNFVHTMLRLMEEKENISVVNDQFGSPTWSYDLAKIIITFIQQKKEGKTIPYGIYNFTNEGIISWFDFAKEIYKQGKETGRLTNECTINPCTSADFSSKVKRPAYSVLNKKKIKKILEIEIPMWEKSLRRFIDA